MSTFINATQVVSAAIGLLLRESVLARLVWRDGLGNFEGAANDTVTIRLPAFTPARVRGIRSGTTRIRDTIHERAVPVVLDRGIYKDVRVTDALLTLDVPQFGQRVLAPVMAGIVRTLEDEVVTRITGATHVNVITFTLASGNAWNDLIVPAREFLNRANVPMDGRVLAVGSAIETALLRNEIFIRADASGSGEALSEATLGRKAGFEIVSVPSLPPAQAYAFHPTAFPLVQRAPAVPAGMGWGEVRDQEGFALRIVRIMDSATIDDILALDAWLGSTVVADPGYYTAAGQFVPAEGPAEAAVTLASSLATNDIINTATAHGYVAGDRIVFPTLTGGAGLVINREYFVSATSLAATTFRPSATSGGAPIDFTTDITAGTVRRHGTDLLVRSVRINGV